MALLIEPDCINCDMCEPECPNEAIFMGNEVYEINPELCTECVGYYDSAQCVSVCPIDCIIADPNNIETKQALAEKFNNLFQ